MLLPNQQFIRRDGKIIFIDNQSMGKNRLININDPVNLNDIVNLRTLENNVKSTEYISKNFVSGEYITKYRVVIKENDKIYIANSSNINHMDKIIGISVTNSNSNNEIVIATQGIISGLAGLIKGHLYFVSSAGFLTNIPPTNGFTQIIGNAINSNTILLDIKSPIGI